MSTPRVSLLDIWVNKLSGPDIVRIVEDAVDAGGRSIIANHNLNSMYLSRRHPRMREFYAFADFVHIDGMSLVLLGNLFGAALRREHRTTLLDLFPLIAQRAVEQGWRIFYLGSRPGVAERAAARLRQQYPSLQIKTHHGHFDADQDSVDNRNVLAEIEAYGPHVLCVGMGMPRQEIWILENQKRLRANAVLTTGALMDYIAGEAPVPPRWLGSLYLEWLYRLLSEPRRLWRRYLVEPWFVAGHIVRHYARQGRRHE
jgi:N-acetylglucosaminyldiphosphoundecaprenol N-acetyl-beta-D-mannosaminyltransferase